MKHRKLTVLMALSLLVSAAVGVYYYRMSQRSSEISVTGFDVPQVEQRRAVSAPSGAEPLAPASSPAPLLGGIDVNSLSPAAARAAAARAAAGYASAENETPEARRRREKEFLAQHGAELTHYEGRLARITGQYFQSSPLVRSVDHDFTRMERYMAVRRKYERDGNPYEFARAAIALPEVRSEISRRLTDPAVWKVSVQMISDALKDPPPAPIYQEAKGFLLHDQEMASYLKQFTDEAGKSMPPDLAATPPAPVAKLVQDVSGAPTR